MRTWNIGNTTVRNPERIPDAVQLFVRAMDGRPFGRAEQFEFQGLMIDAGLVESDRTVDKGEGDDGARKFASAFKQLGLVTDWSYGKLWEATRVGALLARPDRTDELVESIFLRQLLKYQIPSPLESSRVPGFRVRPFRLLLKFLRRTYEEGLLGLTKHEIGLYVITTLTEDATNFEDAFEKIRAFRAKYESLSGNVAKKKFATDELARVAKGLGLKPGTLGDYADSNSRYALMSGLLTLRGNKLALPEARLQYVDALLADGSTLVPDSHYLEYFYDPSMPPLPTDDPAFLHYETVRLLAELQDVATDVGAEWVLPVSPTSNELAELQAYEFRLRADLRQLRELQFYRRQRSSEALEEITQWLENIRDNTLPGGAVYAPAYFEWVVWRLFLAINQLTVPVDRTRGFKIGDDMQPIHHARGGAADLAFGYTNYNLVCEMTLTTGGRQFTMEGEPVTRHVYTAIQASGGKPVYGLFVARQLDPNTADAFHKARYWPSKEWKTPVATPVVALEIDQILALISLMQTQGMLTPSDIRTLLDNILEMQEDYESGPEWFKAYSKYYDNWCNAQSS